MALRLRSYDDDEILAQINIIPLVDVSLVLLIIFIMTINHILTPSIRINLPQSVHASSMSDVGSINISISSEGIIYLEEKIVTLKELEERVKAMYKANPDRNIAVNVDKSTYFQRVVDTLDVLNGLGVKKLDIRTVQKD